MHIKINLSASISVSLRLWNLNTIKIVKFLLFFLSIKYGSFYFPFLWNLRHHSKESLIFFLNFLSSFFNIQDILHWQVPESWNQTRWSFSRKMGWAPNYQISQDRALLCWTWWLTCPFGCRGWKCVLYRICK